MTNQELNTKLYEKLVDSQDRYRTWLLSQPPKEILYHCYEYNIREDIVLALEYTDLTNEQCMALLESSDPLNDIFNDFEHRETDYMTDIMDTMEQRANRLLREAKKETR